MRRGRFALASACGAVVAVASFACRQIVGIGDDPPGSVASGACGMPYTAACADCVTANCCAEANACAGDPSCSPFASCLASHSGDPAGRAKCTLDNQPIGTSSTFAPLYRCTVANCEGPCALPCGGAGPLLTMPDAAASCQACLSSRACGAIRDCTTNAACVAEEYCSLSCQGRSDCYTTCGFQVDSGSPLLEPALSAYRACGSACAIGSNWVCLGKVNWPFPSAPTTTLHLTLYDVESMRPAKGVQASVCSESGVCGSVVGATDDAGDVPVGVQLPPMSTRDSVGPTGAILFSPADDAGASAIAPTLVYWGFALSQPSLAPFGVPVVTPAERAGLVPVMQQTGRGYLALIVDDCYGSPAPGVTFTIEPSGGAQFFYEQASGGLLGTVNQTDTPGLAVVYNVLATTVLVTATLAGSSTIVARETVAVQPDVTTLLFLRPTPAQ